MTSTARARQAKTGTAVRCSVRVDRSQIGCTRLLPCSTVYNITVQLFNPFPVPGISHGRPLARRDRPEGVAGPGGVARRRSMVSRLRPGE